MARLGPFSVPVARSLSVPKRTFGKTAFVIRYSRPGGVIQGVVSEAIEERVRYAAFPKRPTATLPLLTTSDSIKSAHACIISRRSFRYSARL
jgi:hypothetical protein